MTERGLLWRAILWVERFLPTPAPLPRDVDRSAAARRLALLMPVLIIPVVVPIVVRERHELGEVLLLNHALLGQLMLVVAGCVMIAGIGFGMKAWHDTAGNR